MGIGTSRRLPHTNTTSQPSNLNSDWMKDVDGTCSLCDLSIPGTHNSLSLHGGPLVQCQTWSLMIQLLAGIRFIDIRCRHYKNGLPIHHEIIYQKTSFGDVIQQLRDFLRDHPSETVVMRIRKEYKSHANTEDFGETIHKAIQPYKDIIHWLTLPIRLPKLNDVRGKVVILQNFKGPLIGYPYQEFCHIDDFWNVHTILQIDAKIRSVCSHVRAASQSDTKQTKAKLYLTYSNACGAGAYPYTIAHRVNKTLLAMATKSEKATFGIIIMDFPGEELISAIINSNTPMSIQD